MKRTIYLTTVLAAALALAGCDFVMAPEGTDSVADVSLTIAKLTPESDGSIPRAVVQGAGYLYVRTIGGPAGEKGPCYGPYNVSSGETFQTKDIPPGDFDQILIMHSGKQLFTDATYDVDGTKMTFRQIMSMGDADMIEFIKDDDDTAPSRFDAAKDALGSFFEGQACMGIIPKVSLPAGKTTKLSVTLMPITDGNGISLETSPRYAFEKTDSLKRGFYRLEGLYGVTLPVTTGFLNCKLNSLSSGSSVGAVAFYDESGKLVPSTKTGTDLASGLSWRIDAAAANNAVVDGSLRLYMYIEYMGDVVSSFVNTIPPYVSFGFKGNGSAAFKGKKILMGIYGDGTRDSLATGGSWATQMPVSTAILNLDADGNGLAILRANVEAGKNYYFSAQVDVGGHYSGLTNLWDVDIATIIPYQNDYVSKGDPALEAINVYGLSPFKVGEMVATDYNGFEPYTSLVYFVSSGGSGANEGTSPSSPKALDSTFLSTIPTNSQVYVLDSINNLPALTVAGKSVSIKSYGKTVFQLKAQAGLSGYFVGTNGSNSTLNLEDIEINASAVSTLTAPVISLSATSGSLYLGPRSSVLGTTAVAVAPTGGVYVATGNSLTMFGSGIYQCRGTIAGALYIMGTGASVDLRYSTFRFNQDGNSTGNAVIVNSGQVTAKALTITDNTGYPLVNTPLTQGAGTWTNLP